MSRPAVAYINLANLRHNYRLLAGLTPAARIMAVIKADAYGHDLHLVAPALLDEGCRCFAVTDADEGALLRSILGPGSDIVLLSGIFDAADAGLCSAHDLTPVLIEPWQADLLVEAGFGGYIWLKVDTGMRRLGSEDVGALHTACTAHGFGIAGVMSHLACADEPGHELNNAQAARLLEYAGALPPGTPRSLLNSAGMVSMPQHAFEVVRPGIALYGAEPVPSMPLGLKPVMRLCGRVIQLCKVARGESISYGASFTATHDMRVATVAMGYADGLPRLLSNRGRACGGNAILPIVGRVCMDYCLLDTGGTGIGPGTEIEFWGEQLPATEVAETAQTIAYELFTGVGKRIARQAIE